MGPLYQVGHRVAIYWSRSVVRELFPVTSLICVCPSPPSLTAPLMSLVHPLPPHLTISLTLLHLSRHSPYVSLVHFLLSLLLSFLWRYHHVSCLSHPFSCPPCLSYTFVATCSWLLPLTCLFFVTPCSTPMSLLLSLASLTVPLSCLSSCYFPACLLALFRLLLHLSSPSPTHLVLATVSCSSAASLVLFPHVLAVSLSISSTITPSSSTSAITHNYDLV